MKITFVLPYAGLSGGIRSVAIYAEHLQKRGHEVTLVSLPKQQTTLLRQIKSVLKGQGWISNAKQPSHLDGISVSHRILEKIRPVQNQDVPDGDVVIATWWETAEWVAALSDSKGAKAYFLQHYETFDYLPKERVMATWQLPLHKIVVAQWLADVAIKEYGDRNISLVPYSVDLELFSAPPRGKQSQPTIGVMYSPVPWKGCDISLEAFKIAAERIPELRLITFGDCPVSPELPLPAGASFTQAPTQQTLREFYGVCDAWLFGSRYEGFGLPILEAMACRTPVIGTPAGAAPELLADGAGILVPHENPEAMAEAICRICEMSEEHWKKMSGIAYQQVLNYTWEDATDLFEAALLSAISQSQQRTSPQVSVVNELTC